MFVIADIEWITLENGLQAPTQLAAIRVDEHWNEADRFSSFIRPKDSSYHDWNHIAYTGGVPIEFLHAKSAYSVFTNFREWLRDNDTVLWWYRESEKLYRRMVSVILKQQDTHKMISINEYVYAFLSGESHSRGSSYAIAGHRGITLKHDLKHNAANDTRVMRELMAKISYPQKQLLMPLTKPENVPQAEQQMDDKPYQYDPSTNTLHKKDCPRIVGMKAIGCRTLKASIQRGFKPCPCCKDEYRTAFRERNIGIIERSQYTYLFTLGSQVYHKYTCGLMIGAKNIMGTRTYEAIAKTGRRPCKVCNPTPTDVYKPIPAEVKEKRLQKKVERSLPKEQKKALKRQKTAAKEREMALRCDNISEVEKDDIYTLTQPRFAFWASQGYQTFHLRACPKLQSGSHLIGFSTYREAIRAGYSSCKKCKPTAKHDIHISIPITNQIRLDEKLSDLEEMCAKAGYEHHAEGPYLYVVTPVGKWRINISASPITIYHINLAMDPNENEYHEQPRLFLSFVDVFEYIKRHDDELLRKTRQNVKS